MENSDFGRHERVNDILLGRWERPTLRWLAARMPRAITPDILTATGLLAAVLISVSYCLTNLSPNFLWLASFGLALNWFGDSLDGTLARYRKIERPRFGYYIDHTVDALTQSLVGLGIGLSPYISLNVALFLLIGYLLVSIHTYITAHVKRIFKISFGRFGPTEARAILILANTIVYFTGAPAFVVPVVNLTFLELAFCALGVVLVLIFLVSSIKQATALYTAAPAVSTVKLAAEPASAGISQTARREIRAREAINFTA